MTLESRLDRLEKATAEHDAFEADQIDVADELIGIAMMDAGTAVEDRRRLAVLIQGDAVAVDCAVALALAAHKLPGGAEDYAEELRPTPSDHDHTAVLEALEAADPTRALYDLIADRIGERIDIPPAQKTGQNGTG